MKRILALWVLVVLAACSNVETPHPTLLPPSATDTAPAPTTQLPTRSTATSVPAPTDTQDASSFPDATVFKWTPVATGLVSPVDIQFPDDGSGRMFVLEQGGVMLIIKGGQPTTFLDITSKVGSSGNEQGLLGLAFHPDLAHNPFFYINYTETNGDTVIARYQVTGDAADPNSESALLHVDQPFQNHNGGVLTFGPDGYLYAGLGDGGSAGDPFGNGQNKGVLLGKILRLDVDHGDPYTIPADNPFGNEVWDFGLRNPWRISFDKGSGDLFIGDVGQDAWEEVDYELKGQGGQNYGWNFREGSHEYRGQPPATEHLVYPVAEYSHASSHCSVTGGYVYRGSMPEWQGIYLYGDYCSGEIWGMIRDAASKTGWTSQVLFNTGENITSFGQDPAGEVYYAGRGGTIYKLEK